jgi:hypothetical protein
MSNPSGTERPQPGQAVDDGQPHPVPGSAGPDTGQLIIDRSAQVGNQSGGEEHTDVPKR